VHSIGLDERAWERTRKRSEVVWDPSALVNPHVLICGASGSGKSYQAMRLLESAAAAGIEVDAFDLHDELLECSGACANIYSEATRLGTNPLVLSTHPHTGGVRRQVEFVVDLLNSTSRKLGTRQTSARKALLYDTYQTRDITAEDPQSWSRRSITEYEFDGLIAQKDFETLKGCYPIVRDVIRTCERRIRALTLGADSQAVIALERVEKAAAKVAALRSKKAHRDEIDTAQEKLEVAKQQAIDAYADFVGSIESGQEWQEASRYTSADTLRALHERLSELNSIGVFRANPPTWSSNLRVHQIGALRDDERRILVYTQCAAILRQCMDQGQADRLRRLIFLDEGHAMLDDDGHSPLNRIVREGRKFGLGLAIGSQSPTDFSADVLVNTATVIVTGLEAADREFAARKLNAPPELLKAVRPKAVVAVKLKRNGASEDGFKLVNVESRS
jgi:hypothetical protein